MKQTAARIHVLFASRSTDAVVIRRGPSKSVCFVHWNRKTDQFKVGQWMHGQIYERDSALSPDGKHLIYSGYIKRWQTQRYEPGTVISRAPYMKAIAYSDIAGRWYASNHFIDDEAYWHNNFPEHIPLFGTPLLKRDMDFWGRALAEKRYPKRHETLGIYYSLLQRDGWKPVFSGPNTTVFEKQIEGSWILRKFAHSKNDSHEIENTETQMRIACEDWEWAEMDRTRLVWAKDGSLFTGHLRGNELSDIKELFNFNAMQFEVIQAPY